MIRMKEICRPQSVDQINIVNKHERLVLIILQYKLAYMKSIINLRGIYASPQCLEV
jgi:hypothetical protein